MNRTTLFLRVACLALLTGTVQATPIVFTFQENGPGTLGASSIFHEGAYSLTATANPGQTLYAKNSGGDETGLGLTAEGDHEITLRNFVQLTIPTTPGFTLKSISFGSVQRGEVATIWWSAIPNVLGAQVGTVLSDSSFDISSFKTGYIGISAMTGNVLIDSVTGDFEVPDTATTLSLLGAGLLVVEMARRKVAAKSV